MKPKLGLILVLIVLPVAGVQKAAAQPEALFIGSAVKFIYVDGNFDFMGPSTPSCAEGLANSDGGNDPLSPLGPPPTLNSGTELYVPTFLKGGLFTGTQIAVQNVGDASSVVRIFYFDESENFMGCDSGIVTPGSSHVFDTAGIQVDFGCAIIQSLDPDSIPLQDRFDCVGEPVPFKRKEGEKLALVPGPPITAQVQINHGTTSPEEPVRATTFNAFSDRMGDVNFQSNRLRYMLPRVVTSATQTTLFNVFNTTPQATIVDLTYRDEAGGAVIHSASLYLTGYDTQPYNVRDVLQQDFHGSVILEVTDGVETPLAIVAHRVNLSPLLVGSYLAVPLNSGNFDYSASDRAFAPILYEPGSETQVTLANVESSTEDYTVQIRDSFGDVLSTRMVTLGPERTETLSFPDPGTSAGPRVGFVRIDGTDEFHAVLFQRFEDNTETLGQWVTYNIHSGDETVGFTPFGEKGSLPEENGAADLLALPMAGKLDAAHGRVTEILLSNLNPLPGLSAANIHVYDSAGLRDVHCVLLQPLETLRVPVDFPRLGEGALASIVIKGASTSQRPSVGMNQFNTFALAAVAIQRNVFLPDPPDASVELAPGGNDVSASFAGRFALDNPDNGPYTLFFPDLRGLADSEGPMDALSFQVIGDPGAPGTQIGVIFFSESDVVGTTVSPVLAYPAGFRVEPEDIPSQARSAAAFSLIANGTAALGFSAIDRLNVYALFRHVFEAGTPLLVPYGPISGVAERKAPSASGDGGRVLAAYESIPDSGLGTLDPVYSGYAYHLPLLLADEGFDATLTIQNAGLFPGAVEVILRREGALKSSPLVRSLKDLLPMEAALGEKLLLSSADQVIHLDPLRPGTSQSLRVSEIVGAGFRGSAVIRSVQPLAVMAQLESGGTSAAYTAEPYELGYVFNGIPFFSEGSQAAYCPLILDRGHGWDTGIIVQNLNKLVDAKVRVDLYSNAGEVLETRTGFIAPGSSARFDFPASANEIDQEPSASNWLQVTSEEIWQEGTPQALSSNIAVVAHLVRGNDSGCVLESVLYNALSEGEAFNWPGVLNGAGTRHLLIPSFQKSFGEGQVSSVVSVVNVNPHQGSSTLSNVRFLGDGFTTNLSSISVPHRESFFLDSANLLGIPPGSAGVLAMSALPAGSGQVAGPGFAAMVLHRAEGLLPHLPCDATPPTSTPTDFPTETPSFTGTPTSPPTETPTGTPSLVSTETATITDTPSSTVTPTEALVVPTETPTFTSEGPTPTVTVTTSPTDTLGGPTPTASPSPTDTLVGPSPTPTNTFEGPTPTATPTEDELHRADINRNGRVDEEDLLLLLKYWFQLVD